MTFRSRQTNLDGIDGIKDPDVNYIHSDDRYMNIIPAIVAGVSWVVTHGPAIAAAAKKVLSFLGFGKDTTLADLTGPFNSQIDALPQDQRAATIKTIIIDRLTAADGVKAFIIKIGANPSSLMGKTMVKAIAKDPDVNARNEALYKLGVGTMAGNVFDKLYGLLGQFAAYAHLRMLNELLTDNNMIVFNSELAVINPMSDNYSGAKWYFSLPENQSVINQYKAISAARVLAANKSTALQAKYTSFWTWLKTKLSTIKSKI